MSAKKDISKELDKISDGVKQVQKKPISNMKN